MAAIVVIIGGGIEIWQYFEGIRGEETNGPCPPNAVSYVAEDTLTDKEKEQLELIRDGEFVEVAPESFVALASLSGQISESELFEFLCSARTLLAEPTDYYGDGVTDSISLGNRWAIDISRTYNRDVFRKVQDGVKDLVEYVIASRASPVERPPSLAGVTVLIRPSRRFFDVEGIVGAGGRTWVAFDLRL